MIQTRDLGSGVRISLLYAKERHRDPTSQPADTLPTQPLPQSRVHVAAVSIERRITRRTSAFDRNKSWLMMPVPVVNQIRTYWWCSPPRTGRQRMVPASLTARETGASFSKDKCVLISLCNTTTERPRDRGVRASLSVASLGRMPGPYS